MTIPGKVSAIIIVLDGEQFIAEAIESVLAQNHPDLELIIVDDGSRDRTREIVGDYIRSFAKIRLVAHDDLANLGMSASRNLGLCHAAGEFVAFLDTDDVWMPGKISEQVEILQRYPEVAMAYGGTIIWHEWDAASSKPDYEYQLGVEPESLYFPPTLFRQLLRNVHQTPTTCNAMIRRQAIESVGGFDPTFSGMFEDQIFFAKVLASFPVFVSGRQWAKYRQHNRSFSNLAIDRAETARAHRRYLASVRQYLKDRGLGSLNDRVAIRRASLVTRMESARLVFRALLKRVGR